MSGKYRNRRQINETGLLCFAISEQFRYFLETGLFVDGKSQIRPMERRKAGLDILALKDKVATFGEAQARFPRLSGQNQQYRVRQKRSQRALFCTLLLYFHDIILQVLIHLSLYSTYES